MKLVQELTYWEPTGTTDIYGSPTFGIPVRISCRWETKNELFRDKNGQEVNCRSKIYILSKDIDLNGYVFLGKSIEESPINLEGAFEVRAVTKIPDLRNMKSLTVVYV